MCLKKIGPILFFYCMNIFQHNLLFSKGCSLMACYFLYIKYSQLYEIVFTEQQKIKIVQFWHESKSYV